MRAKCLKVEEIKIVYQFSKRVMSSFAYPHAPKWIKVYIEEEALDRDEMEALALRDGFRDFKEMIEFWKGRLPFYGQIIYWEFSGVLKGSLGKRKPRVENKGKARA